MYSSSPCSLANRPWKAEREVRWWFWRRKSGPTQELFFLSETPLALGAPSTSLSHPSPVSPLSNAHPQASCLTTIVTHPPPTPF